MGNPVTELSDLVAIQHDCGHTDLLPWGIILEGSPYIPDGQVLPDCPTCAGNYEVLDMPDGNLAIGLLEGELPYHLQNHISTNESDPF